MPDAQDSQDDEEEPLPAWKALTLVLVGPLVLWLCVALDRMDGPGHGWVLQATLLIGIAWLVGLLRVLRAVKGRVGSRR